MIFRSGLFSRRAGLTPEQFGAHWLEVHGELASHMPGVHTYLQNHIRERLFELSPFPDHPVDGISQQWFDDLAAMERCERSPEYAAVKRDIPNFQGAITILVLEGEPVIDGDAAAGGAKLLVLTRARNAKQGLALVDALPAWADAARRTAVQGPRRYVQNVVVDRAHPVSAQVPQGRVPVDAMAELWFDDTTTLHAWVASAAGQDFIHHHPLAEPLAVYAVEEKQIV